MTETNSLHVWMPNIKGNSGSDVFVERLADGLRRRGVTVTLDWFGRAYEGLPGLLSSRKAPPGAHIIHSNGLNAYPFRHHDLPLVVTEHHYVLDPAYRPYKSSLQHVYHRLLTGRASRRSMVAASSLATPSRFVAASVAAACPNVSPIAIPLWVNLDDFSPSGESATSSMPPLQMLFVGNASRRKGFDIVIELARRMGDRVQIACTGGLRGEMVADLPSNVRWTGRLSNRELIDAYRHCDVVLVPSRYEGFGYAALEGMACAKPVLGFACGSIEEIVEDGISGFLLAVDDVEGLHRRAAELADDPDLRERMGRAGRARAGAEFTEQRGVDAYLALYRALLRK